MAIRIGFYVSIAGGIPNSITALDLYVMHFKYFLGTLEDRLLNLSTMKMYKTLRNV